MPDFPPGSFKYVYTGLENVPEGANLQLSPKLI